MAALGNNEVRFGTEYVPVWDVNELVGNITVLEASDVYPVSNRVEYSPSVGRRDAKGNKRTMFEANKFAHAWARITALSPDRIWLGNPACSVSLAELRAGKVNFGDCRPKLCSPKSYRVIQNGDHILQSDGTNVSIHHVNKLEGSVLHFARVNETPYDSRIHLVSLATPTTIVYEKNNALFFSSIGVMEEQRVELKVEHSSTIIRSLYKNRFTYLEKSRDTLCRLVTLCFTQVDKQFTLDSEKSWSKPITIPTEYQYAAWFNVENNDALICLFNWTNAHIIDAATGNLVQKVKNLSLFALPNGISRSMLYSNSSTFIHHGNKIFDLNTHRIYVLKQDERLQYKNKSGVSTPHQMSTVLCDGEIVAYGAAPDELFRTGTLVNVETYELVVQTAFARFPFPGSAAGAKSEDEAKAKASLENVGAG